PPSIGIVESLHPSQHHPAQTTATIRVHVRSMRILLAGTDGGRRRRRWRDFALVRARMQPSRSRNRRDQRPFGAQNDVIMPVTAAPRTIGTTGYAAWSVELNPGT